MTQMQRNLQQSCGGIATHYMKRLAEITEIHCPRVALQPDRALKNLIHCSGGFESLSHVIGSLCERTDTEPLHSYATYFDSRSNSPPIPVR